MPAQNHIYFHVSESLNLRVIDSLSFLPMKLASLSGTFGLEEMKRGYVPHFYNKQENQNYKGPYPSPESYGYDSVNVNDRAKFLSWPAKKPQVATISIVRKNY